jgi:hypothetical protein
MMKTPPATPPENHPFAVDTESSPTVTPPRSPSSQAKSSQHKKTYPSLWKQAMSIPENGLLSTNTFRPISTQLTPRSSPTTECSISANDSLNSAHKENDNNSGKNLNTPLEEAKPLNWRTFHVRKDNNGRIFILDDDADKKSNHIEKDKLAKKEEETATGCSCLVM